MYARVNRFKLRPEDNDRMIAWWREHIAAESSPGRAGVVLFVNRDTGDGISIGLWESREAMVQDEPANDQRRGEGQSALKHEAQPVERYEVVDRRGAEKGTGAARLTWFEGPPERNDTAIDWWRANIAELWRSQRGGQGAWLLLDRDSGQGISMTLWESDDARQASEEAGSQTRSDASQTLNMRILDVGRYEVADWL